MPTIDTVSALLAKAERTDNTEEADAYLAKAQHLATLYAIDLAVLAAAQSGQPKSSVPVQRTITVGEPRRHANPHLIELFRVIAAANDVVIDIAHNSTYVIAYGIPEDVDTTEAIWLSCAPRMVSDCKVWIASGAWRTDVVRQWQGFRGWVEVPVSARGAKAAFFDAFAGRIGARLGDARTSAIAAADAQRVADSAAGPTAASGAAGAEVVLVAKADQVKDFYRRTTNARGSWRGYRGQSAGGASRSARAGDAAGRQARLGAAKGIGQSRRLEAG